MDIKQEILSQLVEAMELRLAIQSIFQHSTHPKDLVRCSDVAAEVALLLNREVSSPFRKAVRRAAAAAGWTRTVNKANVHYYRYMTRKPSTLQQ